MHPLSLCRLLAAGCLATGLLLASPAFAEDDSKHAKAIAEMEDAAANYRMQAEEYLERSKSEHGREQQWLKSMAENYKKLAEAKVYLAAALKKNSSESLESAKSLYAKVSEKIESLKAEHESFTRGERGNGEKERRFGPRNNDREETAKPQDGVSNTTTPAAAYSAGDANTSFAYLHADPVPAKPIDSNAEYEALKAEIAEIVTDLQQLDQGRIAKP